MQKKLDHVQANAQLAHPDASPTEFSEEEVNAYVNSGQVRLPAGVKSVMSVPLALPTLDPSQ